VRTDNVNDQPFENIRGLLACLELSCLLDIKQGKHFISKKLNCCYD